MKTRLLTLTAAFVACTTPAWAVSALPTHETYSAAADLGNPIFDAGYAAVSDVSTLPGATASVSGNDYSASARTTLGSNHAYAQSNGFNNGAFGVNSFSGWYDQVTITGGTGTGTAQFSVKLNGEVSVGAIAGSAAYGLYATSLHPTQLVDTLNIIDFSAPATQPWALDAPLGYGNSAQLTTITSYAIGASPYNDLSILFPSEISPTPGIPSMGVPALGEEPLYEAPDLVLAPGAGQPVNLTLTGILTFTYGEAFYLISGLGTSLIDGDEFIPFCDFAVGECSAPQTDGTGATTLDFSNSATLVGIVLPEGASASFGSGATYNVTAVPEPGTWAMLLAGLGLVAGAARRRI